MVRAALALILTWAAGSVSAACRLALVFGLDVSGSVDDREYALQLRGLAAALESPEVRARLFQMPHAPVEIAVFEWAATDYQRVILTWHRLDGPEALGRVTRVLRGTARRQPSEGTAIGAALQFGARLLAERPRCWQHTIDLSGDGKNNDWPNPRLVTQSRALDGVTVNALVVGADPESIAILSAYFQGAIIHGPEAFVEIARGYGDYRDAMIRKLIRELEVPVFGRAGRTVSRCSESDRSNTVRPGAAIC